MDLFYFGDGSGKMHYAVINSLSRLLGSSLSGHKSKSGETQERLEEHIRFCSKHEPTRTVMPPKGSIQKFRAHYKTIRHPIAVYYDFECSHKKTDKVYGQTFLKDKYIPVAFGMVAVSDVSACTFWSCYCKWGDGKREEVVKKVGCFAYLEKCNYFYQFVSCVCQQSKARGET